MGEVRSLSQYTPEDILQMDYNQIIGIVKETNRPPGGLQSLLRIAQMTFLNLDKRVLEIGTSTGFTAIELARLTGCHIAAIDINEQSLAEAERRAKQAGVMGHIKFTKMDATKTEFIDNRFDMVFCGNVTSLIANRKQALAEYCRVLKNDGYLVAIPMYYLQTPPDNIIESVSKAIQVNITPLYKRYWTEFFNQDPLQLFFQEDYEFDCIDDDKIHIFINKILTRAHLDTMNSKVKAVLSDRYRELMFLFRDNVAMMGYSILILRKEVDTVDPELFTSTKV